MAANRCCVGYRCRALAVAGACFVIIGWIPASAERTKPIIVDHTCRDILRIPESWINTVKNMILHHTGESHGRQVPHGMLNLALQSPTFAQTQSENDVPDGGGLRITRGQRSEYNSWKSLVDPREYWLDADGKNWTRRTLDYHAVNLIHVNASLHTWCWHLRKWTASQVDDYLASMETLEAEYPDVTFIYMTDTADSTGDTGYNRWLRNEQIRAYCRTNN